MARCSAVIFCDSAKADDKGKPTIRGVISDCHAQAFPTGFDDRVLYLSFFDVHDDITLNIDLANLGSDWIDRLNKEPIVLQKPENGRSFTLLPITTLDIPTPGDYAFVVRDGETEIGRCVFSVEKFTPESA